MPICGLTIEQQMDMVHHHFHAQDGIAIGFLLLQDQLLQTRIQRRSENATAVFGAKDHMILATVDDGMIRVIGLVRLCQFHMPPSLIDCMLTFYHLWLKMARKNLRRKARTSALYSKLQSLGSTARGY